MAKYLLTSRSYYSNKLKKHFPKGSIIEVADGLKPASTWKKLADDAQVGPPAKGKQAVSTPTLSDVAKGVKK